MREPAPPIAAKIPHLPESAGVYLFRDSAGSVLYVGKAKRLRSRVRSYFAQDVLSPRTEALLRLAADIETIVVPNESQALVLESNLIKEYRPRFNVQWRDDKTYPYIKVTVNEPFPRILVTRRFENDGARYFGPFTDVGAMRRALNVVRRVFTVRSCYYRLPDEVPERPCLDYHIGRCRAPCVGLQSREEYAAMIAEVVLFLEGRTSEVVRRIRERMQAAAAAMDYERAAEFRDALLRLEQLEEPAPVVQLGAGDQDAIGIARDGDDACVALLRVRDGRLVAREHKLLENVAEADDAALATLYLAGPYRADSERAPEVLLSLDPGEMELLEPLLPGTRIRIPQRGPKRELVDLAVQNARHLLEEFKLAALEAEQRASNPLYELQRELGLGRVPRSLVCFDVSTSQGRDTVAACVWFENGRARRSEYRKFRVRSVSGVDDYAALREVVERYFRRRVNESKKLPDLVVVDGGKGQLNAVREVLQALNLGNLELASLAKREEEVYVPDRHDPIRLPRRSEALRLVQQARDEAHRFALTFNRGVRRTRTLTSRLLEIPGIGPKRRRTLLQVFGSLEGLRQATPQQIARIPGFSIRSAERILRALSEGSGPPPAGGSGPGKAAPAQ
jgi:excinuclease ABC subunit C